MAQLQFDATQVAPAKPREAIPFDGWFPAIITGSDIKPTQDGSGTKMPLTLEICQGHPFEGYFVFTNLNLVNNNPVAQRIAHEQLSAICHAVGVLKPNDTRELHNLPLLIKLSYVPKQNTTKKNMVTGVDEPVTYDAKNEVKGFAKIGTEQVNMTPKPTGVTTAAAPIASPAWAQGATAAPAPAAAPVAAAAAPAWAPQPAQAPAASAPAPATAAPNVAEGPWGNTSPQPQPAAVSQPVAVASPVGSEVSAPAQAQPQPAWAQGGASAPTTAAPATAPVTDPAPTTVAQSTSPADPAVPAWARGAQ